MANPICHWELMVTDPGRAIPFYRRVFDWRFDETSPEYRMIDTGQAPRGAMMTKPPAAPAPALNVYFEVASVDQTLAKVVEAGGRVIVPRTRVEGVGWFAMFQDPDQIALGIFEEER